MKKNQIIRFFPDTDLRNAHDGLAAIAAKEKVDVRELEPGEFVMFMNHSKTVLKIYCANNIICHLKSPSGRISLSAIKFLPLTFNGRAFNYDEALRASFENLGLRAAA